MLLIRIPVLLCWPCLWGLQLQLYSIITDDPIKEELYPDKTELAEVVKVMISMMENYNISWKELNSQGSGSTLGQEDCVYLADVIGSIGK